MCGYGLCFLLLSLAEALAQKAQHQELKKYQLKVEIVSTNGEGPIGLEVTTLNLETFKIKKHQTGQAKELTRAQWQEWFNKNDRILDRLFFQHERDNRKRLSCLQTATVEVHKDKVKKSGVFCLMNARKDSFTLAFQEFYESTDQLMK